MHAPWPRPFANRRGRNTLSEHVSKGFLRDHRARALACTHTIICQHTESYFSSRIIAF